MENSDIDAAEEAVYASSLMVGSLEGAIEEIDKQLGKGYAAQHPELVGSYLIATAHTMSALLRSRPMFNAAASLADDP